MRSIGQTRIFVSPAFHTVYVVDSSSGRCDRPKSAAIEVRFEDGEVGGMVVSAMTIGEYGEKIGEDVRGKSKL